MFRYFSYIICLQNASLHNVQKIILTSTARMKINKYKNSDNIRDSLTPLLLILFSQLNSLKLSFKLVKCPRAIYHFCGVQCT